MLEVSPGLVLGETLMQTFRNRCLEGCACSMKWSDIARAAGVATLLGGCAASHDVDGPAEGTESFPSNLSSACLNEISDSDNNGLPEHLHCTGLYSDPANTTPSSSLRVFQPANILWSDNLQKQRWIYLPPGSTIDASSPEAWIYPEGTTVWKEFAGVETGKKVETRIYKKLSDTWAKATYEWDDAQKEATRVASGGKDTMVDGHQYRIPSLQECEDCHGGRKDRLMGFEQVSLGLPQAADAPDGLMTLADLVAEDRLTNFNGPTSYKIGPHGDETDNAEVNALGWLHINCGVSCHNDNQNSNGHATSMRLLLDPSQLDGRDTSEFPSIKTTVGQEVSTLRWVGNTRIVAGSPDDSWLHTVINRRQDKEQMPPVGTYVVDDKDVGYVSQWIAAMPKQ
jgi:hypothetical protein